MASKEIDLKVTYRDIEGNRYVSLPTIIELLSLVVIEDSKGYKVDYENLLNFFLNLTRA